MIDTDMYIRYTVLLQAQKQKFDNRLTAQWNEWFGNLGGVWLKPGAFASRQ